jgi:hypothetical protein
MMTRIQVVNSFAAMARGAALCALALFVATACSQDVADKPASAASGEKPALGAGKAFATPEEAVLALGEVIGTGDEAKAEEILGDNAVDLLRSGDDVADHEDAMRVKEMIAKKLAFEDVDDDRKIALLGDEAWPFAIPLVRADGMWSFDVESGIEEIENRRVGRNELRTLATLHALVDAQREYYAEARDGKPVCYARKVMSSEGKHDGLYWPVAEGQPESPLGPEVAEASSEGYKRAEDGERPPFHGYYFHILLSQGKNAPGGPKEYVDKNGLLTGGYAAVAWPARYGNSGVKTFLVSQRGVVYSKDLGEQTADLAVAMKEFDPDDSWDPDGDD